MVPGRSNPPTLLASNRDAIGLCPNGWLEAAVSWDGNDPVKVTMHRAAKFVA